MVDQVIPLYGSKVFPVTPSREDTRTFSQFAEIMNLSYPIGVGFGVPFPVSYEAVNKTNNSLHLFGYITDGDFNMFSSSYWEYNVPAMAYYPSSTQIEGINEDLDGIVVIGHIEGFEMSPAIVLIPIALIAAAVILYKH